MGAGHPAPAAPDPGGIRYGIQLGQRGAELAKAAAQAHQLA